MQLVGSKIPLGRSEDKNFQETSRILEAFIIFVFTKIIVLLAAGATSIEGLQNLAYRWDGEHFIRIAERGYTNIASYAFAPFYPYLIRLVSYLGLSTWLSALIISNVFSIIFLILLGRVYGWRIAWMILAFPTIALYTTVAYSESVALAFLAASIHEYRRGRMFLASTFIVIGAFARYALAWAGIILVLIVIARRRIKEVVEVIAPVIIGTIAILAWFKHSAGTYTVYFEAEKYWAAGMGTPIDQIKWLEEGPILWQFGTLRGIPTPPLIYIVRNYLFLLLPLIGGIIGLYRKDSNITGFEMSYSLLNNIILFTITGVPSISIPRLLAPSFPLLVPIYKIAYRSKLALAILLVGSFSAIAVSTLWHVESFFS